jgi:hypothetical protein
VRLARLPTVEGKDKVIAGSLKTRLQAKASGLLSDEKKAQFHRTLSEPGSGTEPEHK